MRNDQIEPNCQYCPALASRWHLLCCWISWPPGRLSVSFGRRVTSEQRSSGQHPAVLRAIKPPIWLLPGHSGLSSVRHLYCGVGEGVTLPYVWGTTTRHRLMQPILSIRSLSPHIFR